MSPNKTFLERLIERLDRLDRRELEDYLVNLTREKGLLQSIFNSLREGLLVIDPEGRIVFINRAATSLLDIPAESEGQFASDTIEDPLLLSIVKEGLELPEQSLVKELQVMHPRPAWVRLSRSSLRDQDGEVRGIMLLLSDISRERKAEEEVNLAARLDFLIHLTAAIAHELGNPLTSLTIHIQLMERLIREIGGEAGEKLLRSALIIREEIKRLDEIVEQFLRALRPAPLDLSDQNLKAIIEQVLALVSDELKERNISVKCSYPREGLRGLLDKNLIKQAMLNLIKNAAQAMMPGGEILVKLEKEDFYFKISVTDRGVGIPPEKIPRIFEPFYTTKERGSGLGLLVVYKIMRQHGGSVEVKSRPGRGTTFILWLPQRPEKIKLLPSSSRLEKPKTAELKDR